MKYLVIINREFPCKKGEAYLENEINEIAKYFDKVLIFPGDATIDEKETRKIDSKNVQVIKYETKSLKIRKMLYVLSSIKYFFSKENEGHTFINKVEEAYFLSAAKKQYKKILKEIEKIKITSDDEVYLYSYWLYINAKVVTYLKEYFNNKKIKVKSFSRAHRFDIYEERRKYNYLPQREHLLNDLDSVFPCSVNGVNHIASRYPKYKKKIQVSYLGTYDHGLNKEEIDEYFTIVSCSWLIKVKRVDLIIEALSKIQDKKIRWIHLGGGPLQEELELLAKQKLSHIDYTFSGNKKNYEILDFYKNNHVDLFINVSSSEGLPVSIMEVASFGIPILATDVGGTNEIVSKENGALIPEHIGIDELKDEIEKLIDDKKIAKKRQNSRKIWEERFNAKKNYKEFIETAMR